MADRYLSFADLAAHEREGVDYRIRAIDRDAPVAVVAPHGGEIEPGTSEIAAAIAGDDLSLYCFEGLKLGRPHGDLHITSPRFDEPRCLALVASCERVVGVHGRRDRDDLQSVWMGGADVDRRDRIAVALDKAGFIAITDGHALTGDQPTNICNRGRSGAGVQLEIPAALRDELRQDIQRLQAFADAVRSVLIDPEA